MGRDYYEREETNAATKLTYLLIGGGIGAVIALLFAPKSGTELRGDIANGVDVWHVRRHLVVDEYPAT